MSTKQRDNKSILVGTNNSESVMSYIKNRGVATLTSVDTDGGDTQ